MEDSASESDSGSANSSATSLSPASREQLEKRFESLHQQIRVLTVEIDTYKLRIKALQEENKNLRQNSVNIQARAEQQEEFISNTLLKKISLLKKEKETLALRYEQEEECLTNDLSRKLQRLSQEKSKLEQTLEHEQEWMVNKLVRKIEKLENQTAGQKALLEEVRREKIELVNVLGQEQEALVNRLWKRMEKLEEEKRSLQVKLQTFLIDPTLPQADKDDTVSSSNFDISVDIHNRLENIERKKSEEIKQSAFEKKTSSIDNTGTRSKVEHGALNNHIIQSGKNLQEGKCHPCDEIDTNKNSTVTHQEGASISFGSFPPLSHFGNPNLLLGTPQDLPVRCYACNQLIRYAGTTTSAVSFDKFVPQETDQSTPGVGQDHLLNEECFKLQNLSSATPAAATLENEPQPTQDPVMVP